MGKRLLPYKARHDNGRDRWQFFVFGLAQIAEGLVTVLSLGYLTTDIYSWVLFDVFDDD